MSPVELPRGCFGLKVHKKSSPKQTVEIRSFQAEDSRVHIVGAALKFDSSHRFHIKGTCVCLPNMSFQVKKLLVQIFVNSETIFKSPNCNICTFEGHPLPQYY